MSKFFSGKVILRNSDYDYKIATNQYATTSVNDNPELMNPSMIVYAKDDNDVINVIRYAIEKDVAIAIRTGGHQYSGYSSTSGKNIQLDLSRTYMDIDVTKLNNEEFTCGISLNLTEFSELCIKYNFSVPHGICGDVHLGGHVQTGGYGAFTNMFGLFGDHVIGFRIITADTKIRNITKENNPDLFWAVLGGSPGNFGVLTHITLKVNPDKKYNVIKYRIFYPYRKEHFRNLLNLFINLNGTKNKLIDYSITIFSEIYEKQDAAKEIKQSKINENLYNDIYHVKEDYFYDKITMLPIPLMMISISTSLSEIDITNNLLNDVYKTSPTNISLFAKNIDPLRKTFIYKECLSIQMRVDYNLNDSREFNLPFCKRMYYTSDSSEKLQKNNWSNQYTDQIDKLVSTFYSKNDCKLVCQVAFFGEKTSKYYENKDNGTSYNLRDCTIMAGSDIFYFTNGKEYAEQWVKDSDELFIGPNGSFSNEDKRFLAFSFQKNETESKEIDLKYVDNSDKLLKLQKIKNKYDPLQIFSANSFSISGSKEKRINDPIVSLILDLSKICCS